MFRDLLVARSQCRNWTIGGSLTDNPNLTTGLNMEMQVRVELDNVQFKNPAQYLAEVEALLEGGTTGG